MINEEFQPGFYGLLGSGAGMHTASKSERFDHDLVNRIENAIMQLWGLVSTQGHYGPFRLEVTSGYTTETFEGDGSTQTFTLSMSIPKEFVSGYNILYDDPYASGISPSGGYLTSFSSSTNLSNTLYFDTAPTDGESVTISYANLIRWPSAVNSSAYLLSEQIT